MPSKKNETLLKKLKILYVEDEEDILKFAKMALEDYVKEFFTARNGKEALEILKTQNIDLVITDILMPKLNGINLIKEIKQNLLWNMAVLIATDHTETQSLLDFIELRVVG